SIKAGRSSWLDSKPKATTTSSRNLGPPKTRSRPRKGNKVMAVAPKEIQSNEDYKFGFHDEEDYFFKARRGLSEDIVRQISAHKDEPDWMTKFRVRAYNHFLKRPVPNWGGALDEIDFDNIFYYIKPAEAQGKTWEEVPEYIKDTFDKLGIPQAERKFLAGVSAQYESEVVYHSIREDLEKLGVIFTDMDTGLREHGDIVKKYFGTVIP